MDETETCQPIVDVEHLRLLTLGYYISAATTALFSCFGLIYVFMGLMFVLGKIPEGPGRGVPPPQFLGWIFAGVGGAIALGGLTLACLKAYAGHCLSRRRHRAYCLVVAGLSCLGIPWGTLIGVSTFMVLSRPSVERLFAASAAGVADPDIQS